jgi:hypothetical protein
VGSPLIFLTTWSIGYQNKRGTMVITTGEQYTELVNRMAREQYFYCPVFSDLHYHRMENQVLCAGIVFMNGETFMFSVSHPDAPPFPLPDETSTRVTLDDVMAIQYQSNMEVVLPEKFNTPYIRDTYNTFSNLTHINRIIPISVWLKVLQDYSAVLNTLDVPKTPNFTQQLLKVLRSVEDAGLRVERPLLAHHFGSKALRYFKGDFVYSQYNVVTATGRPSNRYGGINYSALNKHDGSRATFVSRYPGGTLLQFDYEAYHLRLIAEHLGITLPNGSIHEEFGKHYFPDQPWNDALYAASKQKTFSLLYGDSSNTYGIPFFDKVKAFRNSFSNQTSITLPTGMKVEVDSPSASKLFNYYVQSLEIYQTLPKLAQILQMLSGTNNHLILYTYDSILLDMEALDKKIIYDIMFVLQEDEKYPVRTYFGENYNNLIEI